LRLAIPIYSSKKTSVEDGKSIVLNASRGFASSVPRSDQFNTSSQ
jgi:hypothetical protein